MILKGKRTNLRSVKLSDAKIFTKWYSDPDIYKFFTGKPATLARQKKQIGLSIKAKDVENFVVETKDGVPIGHLIFFLDKDNNSGSFGMAIGEKNYRGKGYASDAVETLLKYGFGKIHLHHIHLAGNGTMENNKRAIKSAESLGFVREGILRDRLKLDGKYYNMIPMSILESEWRRKINKKL